MPSTGECVLERAGALQPAPQRGAKREVARRPQSREREREQRTSVAAIARRDGRRQRHDGVQQLSIVADLEWPRPREGGKRGVAGHILMLAANHVSRELTLVDRPGEGAVEEGEERAKVAMTVVYRRRREQDHASTHEPVREVTIPRRSRRAGVMRLVENHEV